MKRKSDRPLSKHTLNLYAGQMEWLQDNHGRLGAALVIRTLVEDHIRQTQEGVAQKLEPLPEPKVTLEDIL